MKIEAFDWGSFEVRETRIDSTVTNKMRRGVEVWEFMIAASDLFLCFFQSAE